MPTRRGKAGLWSVAVGILLLEIALLFALTNIGGSPDWVAAVIGFAGLLIAVTGLSSSFRGRPNTA